MCVGYLIKQIIVTVSVSYWGNILSFLCQIKINMKFYLKLFKIVDFIDPLFLIHTWKYSMCQLLEQIAPALNTINHEDKIFSEL